MMKGRLSRRRLAARSPLSKVGCVIKHTADALKNDKFSGSLVVHLKHHLVAMAAKEHFASGCELLINMTHVKRLTARSRKHIDMQGKVS
jgi:hypothetical protein